VFQGHREFGRVQNLLDAGRRILRTHRAFLNRR
jgi:hypothetical protein